MRTAATALLLALALSSCVAKPAPSDWLAVGFRTPEQTFRTFQTAFAGDAADLEYRCLSIGFRKREQLSEFVYLEAREELLRRMPWVKQVARAEVTSSRPLDERAWELVAQIDTLFLETRLRIVLVREQFWELYDTQGNLIESDELKLSAQLIEQPNSAGVIYLIALVPAPSGIDKNDVAELRVTTEWKIDGLELVDGDSPEP